MRGALLAFLAGSLIEASCVMWVEFSGRNMAALTALCSMLIACCQVAGLSEALLAKGRRLSAVGYVLGFGFGTFSTVWLKAHF